MRFYLWIVLFQETATVVDISNLLMETGGKISGGPQAEGRYVIVFPDDTDQSYDVICVLRIFPMEESLG